MRGAANTPGRRAARSRIRGLSLLSGGSAPRRPALISWRKDRPCFSSPGACSPGIFPGSKSGGFGLRRSRLPSRLRGRLRRPQHWGFLATGEDRNGETRRGRARLRPTAPAGPPAARRAPVSVGFGAGWPRPPKRRRRQRRRRAAAAATDLETAPPTAPPRAVFCLLPARDAAQPPSRSIPAPRSRPELCSARYGIEWHGVCGAPVGWQTQRGARGAVQRTGNARWAGGRRTSRARLRTETRRSPPCNAENAGSNNPGLEVGGSRAAERVG